MKGAGPVLLFDGDCGLCVALVRLLLRSDRRGSLRFAALQGAHGQAALRKRGLPTADFDSLVYLPEGNEGPALLRTDGALAVLAELGGAWGRVAAAGRRVPAPWRDAAYRAVARLRYAIFGRVRPGAGLTEAEASGRLLL